MKPFFSTPERLALLVSVEASWHGTPFMPNAAIKGVGVSCQKYAGCFYMECGLISASFKIPDEPMNWSHAHTDSLIEKFMAEQVAAGRFAEIPLPVGNALPGDMVGILYGGCVHHCGVVFKETKFTHCYRPSGNPGRGAGQTHGVIISNLLEPVYRRMIKKIWRPLDVN